MGIIPHALARLSDSLRDLVGAEMGIEIEIEIEIEIDISKIYSSLLRLLRLLRMILASISLLGLRWRYQRPIHLSFVFCIKNEPAFPLG